MINVIGWIGSALLAGCGVPQAYLCWKQGHAEGVAPLFLWMWVIGEILTFSYILITSGATQLPLVMNYGANTVMVFLILRYKYFPRK